MTRLFEIKDKVFKFCAQYESYLKFVYKFVIALILFCIINGSVGFMETISSFPVALLLALVCCLLPQGATLLIAAVLVVLNLYVLSLEVAITALAIFVIVFLVYFRFAPQDCTLFTITPILYALRIPYILPIGAGLLRKSYSIIAVVCGTISFYFLNGIYENVSALATTGSGEGTTAKMTITVSQLLSNKEMYLAVGIVVLSGIVVSVVRKLVIDHAWKIAVISGVLVQVAGLFAGYLLFNISGKTLGMIIGNIIALLLGFVIEFLFMDLDYERTERVQFEDDDYYYYVKAVPKKMVTSSEKTIKQFNEGTGFEKKAKRKIDGVSESRRSIVEELDIDDEFFK